MMPYLRYALAKQDIQFTATIQHQSGGCQNLEEEQGSCSRQEAKDCQRTETEVTIFPPVYHHLSHEEGSAEGNYNWATDTITCCSKQTLR